MRGFSGAMFTLFSAAVIHVKCSTIYPTMQSNHLRSHMVFAFHGVAQTWLVLNTGLLWGKFREQPQQCSLMYLSNSLWISASTRQSPLMKHRGRNIPHRGRLVPLEKEFLLRGRWWLYLVVSPVCSEHEVAQNQIWHQPLATAQNLPFVYCLPPDFISWMN